MAASCSKDPTHIRSQEYTPQVAIRIDFEVDVVAGVFDALFFLLLPWARLERELNLAFQPALPERGAQEIPELASRLTFTGHGTHKRTRSCLPSGTFFGTNPNGSKPWLSFGGARDNACTICGSITVASLLSSPVVLRQYLLTPHPLTIIHTIWQPVAARISYTSADRNTHHKSPYALTSKLMSLLESLMLYSFCSFLGQDSRES